MVFPRSVNASPIDFVPKITSVSDRDMSLTAVETCLRAALHCESTRFVASPVAALTFSYWARVAGGNLSPAAICASIMRTQERSISSAVEVAALAMMS